MNANRSGNDLIIPAAFFLSALLAVSCIAADQEKPATAPAPDQHYRRLPVAEYVDKMKAGWIGQMAGVGWGAPTEFRYRGRIIPPDEMPQWRPDMINQFNQDDIYVEMTFLRSLEVHGLGLTARQAGIDFANSGYKLWHANRAARDNLRAGVAPPDSGHPLLSLHADDIDFQIEADFAGLIAPGLPNAAIGLCETFGRIMNYGDGLYAGQFVGGMYAEAYFVSDPVKIVKAGLRCIPRESQYAGAIRDVLEWYGQDRGDWIKTWKKVNEKYHLDGAYRKFSCSGAGSDFNIDAKINGIFIVMGVLFGQGDLDRTIEISMRCGQDSDCNPSNAAGVIFLTRGLSRLPARFTSALDADRVFSHTSYSFTDLIAVCKNLAGEMVVRHGGRIEKEANGAEVFVIPVRTPMPSPLEECWNPGPVARSRFTDEERALIREDFYRNSPRAADIEPDLEKFAPGWRAVNCGPAMEPGLHSEMGGKSRVLVTHPLDRDTGCTLFREITVGGEGATRLRLVVGHHPKGDWLLVVRADRRILFREPVSASTCGGGWRTVTVDLSEFAGRTVKLELENQASDWAWEGAYWDEILIEKE